MYKKSIVSIFASFGAVAIIMLLFTYLFIFCVLKEQNKAQNQFIYKVSSANNLIVDIEKCKSSIQQYRHDWDMTYLEMYKKNVDCLNLDVDAYLSDSNSFSQENMQSVRRLQNFISYQSNLFDGISESKATRYNTVSYILEALSMHQSDIYMVLQSDMQNGCHDFISVERSGYLKLISCLVLFLIFIVIIGFLFVSLQKKLLEYIHRLNINLSQISKQNWQIEDLDVDSFYEFNSISSGVNRMKKKLYEYFTKIEKQNEIEKQLSQKLIENEKQKAQMIEAEMVNLKAQVNPHFLFNALHQIGMASLVSEPSTILNLVEATGKILRYSLYNSDDFVSLCDEIDIVKTYIFLQRQSSDADFSFVLDMPSDTMEYPILPMCIQPIVENSFKHGFQKRRSDDWKLVIKCQNTSNCLKVSIYDNGYGFDIKSIEKSKGIGLENIKRRLKLQYGRDDLLQIDSILGKYTEIIVCFPVGED